MAVRRLDQVEVDTIDRETADQALKAIAEPLRQLGQLQRMLTLRRELSRRTRADPSYGPSDGIQASGPLSAD